MKDWAAWHDHYDQPDSSLAARLTVVQSAVRDALDRLPPGEIRLVSMCAGQGRDVVDVLVDHARREDVAACLVELDPRNAAYARAAAVAAGLARVDVRTEDAGLSDAYVGAVPAQVVLACGVFGNVTDDDIVRTVRLLPRLCADGGTVIWTRGRWKGNDLTPSIRRWFVEAGFEEVDFVAPGELGFSVGINRLVARLTAAPGEPLDPGIRLFEFVDDKKIAT